MLKNCKAAGEIGQTITWIIATLIIITFMVLSIFATTGLVKVKATEEAGKHVVNIFASSQNVKQADLFAEKSLESYLSTNINSATIYQQLQNEGNLNDANGNLAKNIFQKFYENQYKIIWLTVYSKPNKIVPNNFFKPPVCGRGITTEFKLNSEKYVMLTLTTSC
ncbi:MAG TPA: hypothetical protein VMC80_01275 [Patescibacteria group bacterium]|nr:hypothetical protein [Patescibacteria group bacterium]